MEVTEIGKKQIIWEKIPFDLFTPVSAFMLLRKCGATFLMESVESGEKVGRYSFIGFSPEDQVLVEGSELKSGKGSFKINRKNVGKIWSELFEYQSGQESFIRELENVPFIGGWAGYIAYDFVPFLEEIELRKSERNFPSVNLLRTNRLLVFDHVKNTAYLLVVLKGLESTDALNFISSVKKILNDQSIFSLLDYEAVCNSCFPEASLNYEEFIRRVSKAKDYIRKGEIFQVVLSVKFKGRTEADPFEIYRALRIINPSPYMFFFDFGKFQLIGSSPESHVKVSGGKASIRPIAGTRRRGKDPSDDARLQEELINHKKEQAEHNMLIDLARNDLGKICLPGSVVVTEQKKIEKYSHVMHMVSQVEGSLRPGTSFFDLIQATFPAGTVTGAPKLRAIEIIDELEPVARGPYAGVVGYLSDNGQLDFCLGIRMIICLEDSFEIQGGAGIVIDSVPEHEYLEIKNKTAALVQAVRIAERRRELK